jgi:SAM-dependent methyltransferase
MHGSLRLLRATILQMRGIGENGNENMKDRDRAEVTHFFNDNLRRYGYDPRSLGWTPGTQETRFRVLTAIGDLEGCTVLDVGCGFGDLYEYLCRNGIDVDYTGVDISHDILEVARQRHPDAKFIVADFEEATIHGRFDWAFESGVFNYKVSDHETFVRNMIRKMLKASTRGIAADFLNHRGGFLSAGLYHPDPADIYAMCSKLSRRVTLRCDYKPTEFCVYLYRDVKEGPGNVYPNYEKAFSDLTGRRRPDGR